MIEILILDKGFDWYNGYCCRMGHGKAPSKGGARNFCLGGSRCNSNIFIKITPHIHIHTLFYYIHSFLFDKLYIYTHQTTTKELSNFNQNYVRWRSYIK